MLGGTNVPLVKIKQKYQVTLPASVRQQADLKIGDILEAEVSGKRITLTPKGVVDRELALALDDVKHGRVSRVYNTAQDLISDLHRKRARYLRKKTATRRS